MPLVKAVSVKMTVDGVENAKLKIAEVDVAAKKLEKDNPTITPQIEKAKALLQARLLREGLKAELSKITEDVSVKSGGNGNLFQRGIFAAFNNNWAQNGGSSLLTNPAAIAGIAVAAGTLLPELGGLVAGFAAATAGVGAFAAVGLPTFQKLTGDIAALHSANQSFEESALNVDTALKHSWQDAAAYHTALAAMRPNLAAATKLLGDQNVRWQDLSKSQQNNIVALDNNKKATALLLPAQKTALSALLSAKTAWDDMNPAQQKAATSLNQLANGYQKVVTALQPDVFKVLNQGLKVANNLLPALQPLAQAGATAIDGLLKKLATFTQSKGFKDWLSQFDKLAGPSIAAIGHGIGEIVTAVGKLITSFSSRDAAHAINDFFDTIYGAIRALTWVIVHLMHNWDDLSQRVATAWHWIVRATEVAVTGILGFLGMIVDGAAKAFGWIPGIGPALRRAAGEFDAFRAQVTGSLAGISGAAGSAAAALANVGVAAQNAYNAASSAGAGIRKYLPAPHAAGGPASGMILVGERGPELLQVPTGSYVYNNSQTRGMLSGASGGATYNINVRVAPGGEREAGRQIVNAIRAFELGSGSSWRKR